MKKIIILIIPVLLMIFMSCSLDECESPEVSYIDIVINESPWIFHHSEFEIRSNTDGYEFTNLEIDEIEKKEIQHYENSYQGSTLLFNKDGTGIYYSYRWNHVFDIDWNSIEKNGIRWDDSSTPPANYSYLKNTGMVPELSWEWIYRRVYDRKGEPIEYIYKISLVFR